MSGEKGLTTETPSDDEELHPTLRDPLLQLTVLTSTGLNVAPTSEVWSEDQPKPTEDNLLLSQDPEANDWLRNCVVDMLRERQMNTDSLKFGLVDDWPNRPLILLDERRRDDLGIHAVKEFTVHGAGQLENVARPVWRGRPHQQCADGRNESYESYVEREG